MGKMVRDYPIRAVEVVWSPLLNDVESAKKWYDMVRRYYDRPNRVSSAEYLFDETSRLQKIIEYNKGL